MDASEAYKIASEKWPLDFTSCYETSALFIFSSDGLNSSYSVDKSTGETKAFMPLRDCTMLDFATKKPITDFR